MAKQTVHESIPEHKPYVPSEKIIPELTIRSIILGSIFGILFGAVSVYLGLKVGLTVSASIPVAVLAITILKYLGTSEYFRKQHSANHRIRG